jgi:VWFA-related protein
VVRVETSLVVCDVLVMDKQGQPVPGLTQSDFIVTENDNRQEIGIFSLGDDTAIPRSIVLIMDYSGSLSPYIQMTVDAAKELVDKLGPKDTMAIVTDDLSLLADFTRDRAELKQKLESLKEKAKEEAARRGWYSGHSLQFSALLATLREMFDNEDISPIIIFQTDGDELEILPPVPEPYYASIARPFSLKDVYAEVERSRATIYSVIPGVRFAGLSEHQQLNQAKEYLRTNNQNNNDKAFSRMWERGSLSGLARGVIERRLRRQLAVAAVAELTGGRTEFLEQPSQAAEIYSRILSGINRRYVVGYYPTNEGQDGKLRTVRVEIRGHPEYTVWGRKSYYAPRMEGPGFHGSQ